VRLPIITGSFCKGRAPVDSLRLPGRCHYGGDLNARRVDSFAVYLRQERPLTHAIRKAALHCTGPCGDHEATAT
jgi:hypothetical protein